MGKVADEMRDNFFLKRLPSVLFFTVDLSNTFLFFFFVSKQSLVVFVYPQLCFRVIGNHRNL